MSVLNFIEQELPKTTSAIILLLSFKDTVFEKKFNRRHQCLISRNLPKQKLSRKCKGGLWAANAKWSYVN